MPRWFRTVLALGCLVVTLATSVPAEATGARHPQSRPTWQLHRWTIRDGLPQGSVNGIAEAPDGALWLATFGGLVRFDGVWFRVYDFASRPALPSNRVLAVAVAADGIVWCVTEGGVVCRLDFERDEVRQWTLEEGFEGLIHSLEVDGARVLVASEYGLDIIEPESDAPVRVVDGRTDAIFRDPRDDTVWLSANDALATLDGETVTPRFPLTGRARFGVIGEDLVAVTSSAAYRVTPTGLDVVAQIMSLQRILWVGEGLDGGAIVGTYDGFHVIPGLLAPAREMATEPRLDMHQIAAIKRDRSGQFWIGTRGGGLVRLRRAPVTLRAVLPNVNEPYAIVADPGSGTVWAAVRSSLVRLDGGRNVEIATGATPLDGGLIRLRDGTMLWSTGDRVRAFVDDVERPELMRTYDESAIGVVHGFAEDEHGVVWLASSNGLWRWTRDAPPSRVEHAGRALDGAKVVNTDGRRVVWCASDREVWRYDMERGAVDLAQRIDSARAGSTVRSVCAGLPGRACVGTYGAGLVIVSESEVRRITTEDGLPENVISSVHVNREEDAVWMLGNRGVYRLAYSAWDAFVETGGPFPRYRSFTTEDGMVEGSRGAPAIVSLGRGQVAMVTIEGVAMLRDSVGTPQLSPPRIAMMIVDGEPVPVHAGVALHIPPTARRIEFECSVVNLVAPSDTWFGFRLADDEPWQTARSGRIAFGQLAAGEHRLQVRAALGDGAWAEADAPVRVVRDPAWHETPLFRLSGVAGPMLLMLVVLIAYRVRHRRRVAVMRQEIDVRSRAADRERRLRNELDHRVRNNLAAVLSLLELTRGRPEDLRNAVSSRVRAMANVHSLLSSRSWASVQLREIIERVFGAGPGMHGRLEVTGDDPKLSADRCRAFALVLYELAENSRRHGAWRTDDGLVAITAEMEEDDLCRFEWREMNLQPLAPRGSGGLGMDLIRGFATHDLSGSADVAFEPAGVVVTIRMRVTAPATACESSMERR